MNEKTSRRILYKTIIVMMANMQASCSSMEVSQDISVSRDYIKAEKAYSKKNYTLAKKHYLVVIEKYPAHVNGLFRLGNISMREKKWDNAIKLYNKVLRIEPTHEKSHHNLAMLHLSLARDHLYYYIAHNNTLQNKPMGELIHAINRYSENRGNNKTTLEELTDIISK